MKKKIKLEKFKVTSFVAEIKSDEVVNTVKGGWSGHPLYCSRFCPPVFTEGIACNTVIDCGTNDYGLCQIP